MRLFLKSFIAIILFLPFTIANLQAQDANVKKGTLAGKVSDAKSGEEIIGATVSVENTTNGSSTDLDGKYFLKLVPGTYTIVVSYVSYKTKKLEGIEIKAGELNSLNITLSEDSKELEEIVITGEARKESAAGLLLQQKNAVAVSSGISAELIRKMPDRTTADVIKRVSGASIQDGKFAVIRGLQDRYNYGMINGTPLPSSETDKKAFSLDIVPAQVVDNMIISKTGSPDMPGDFAGGVIQINTRDIPEENTRFINVGIGSHSLTTSKDFYKSPQAGSTDWLGFDNGGRQLPGNIASTDPNQNVLLNRTNDDLLITEQTKSFNNSFVPIKSTAQPNYSLQAGFSQRLKIFNNDFGVIGAITYNNANKNVPTTANTDLSIAQDDKSFVTTNPYYYSQEYIASKNNTNLGGILNFSYKVGQNLKFSFKNLLTQNSESTSFIRDLDRINDGGIGTITYAKQYSNYFSANRMFSSQFGFEKYFEKSKIKLKGNVGYNNLFRDVPDFKFMAYNTGILNPTDYKQYGLKINSPTHAAISSGLYTPGRFFSKLNEFSYSANLDFSIPFVLGVKHELKAGVMYQERDRRFNSRLFSLNYVQGSNNYIDSYATNADSLAPANVFNDNTLGSPNKIFAYENTRKFNQYTAGSSLRAGYVMFETKATAQLRVIYGVRVESFTQKLKSTAADNTTDIDLNVTWVDPLPSVNVIYAITDKMNLRANYAKTVSRPEFREFAPLQFFDVITNNLTEGNPALTRATIQNFDLKYEIFPTGSSTFSVNPFVKQFYNPIELTLEPKGQEIFAYTYNNAKGALNYGVEFEARLNPTLFSKNLSKGWENLVVFGNYTYIYSKVDLSNIQNANASGFDVQSRPMQGQSPYVFNAGIQYSHPETGWDFTLSGNQIGRRIFAVANQENRIIWENSRLVIDGSISKTFLNEKLKFRGVLGDLLAQDLIFYMDIDKNGTYNSENDALIYKYRNGQTFSIQAIYNF